MAGSWKSRRLFAVVAQEHAPDYQLCQGDCLIVEPGGNVSSSGYAIVRKGEQLGLKKLQNNGPRASDYWQNAKRQPFRSPRLAVVGNVIGVIRANRRKAALPHKERQSQHASVKVTVALRSENQHRTAQDLLRWRSISPGLEIAPARHAQLQRSLETLAACLDEANSERLYEALACELNRIIRKMNRESAILGLKFEELRLPSETRKAVREPDFGRLHIESFRTLDTGATGMI